MKKLIWVWTAGLAVAVAACSSKNTNNDVDPGTATGRSAPASWSSVKAEWTRIDPWDGSCPQVKFESDADGNFKTEGCGGEQTGKLTDFEINRLNEAANDVVPMLGNAVACDLQKTPNLKVEQTLSLPEGLVKKYLYTQKDFSNCRVGEIPQITTLGRVLLDLQLKYEAGLPKPSPTPTPVPTPTPPPLPLPGEPIPIPPTPGPTPVFPGF
jgi:hypothetical protein